MRSRLALLLISLTFVGLGAAGCAKPTMQGTPQRQPGMIMSEDQMPDLLLDEAALAELAGVPVEDVTSPDDVDPKTETAAGIPDPIECETFAISSAFQGVRPGFDYIAAFRPDGGGAAEDLGVSRTVSVALFSSPSVAAARLDDLESLIAPCAEHRIVFSDESSFILQVSRSEVEGLTLPAVAVQRKALVDVDLQSEGYGATSADVYLLFRNSVLMVSVRELGLRTPDPAAVSELSLAVQEHLLSLG